MASLPSVHATGDQGWLIRLGDSISPEVHQRVLACLRAFDARRRDWLIDCVPGYASVLVVYDCGRAAASEVRAWVAESLEVAASAAPAPAPRLVRLPVFYDPRVAPDLENLARAKDLRIDELVAAHTAPEYLVYMLGFRPGFPFMGGLDPRLATPRLATPRLAVPAGSVGIGGQQTGVYPMRSPGGWRIIGRTPLRLFDRTRDDPFHIHMGDRVKLESIDEAGYRQLGGEV